VPQGVAIASASHADLEAIGGLFEDHTGRPADLATLGGWVREAPAVVARCDGALVGYAVTKGFAPDVVELAALLVAPGHRSHGIGTLLVDAIEADARRRGHAAIVVVTSAGYEVVGDKRSAVPFYERRGYHPILRTEITTVLGRSLSDDHGAAAGVDGS
jgi:GNAT superfamily N-acetyltransferase